MTRPGCDCNEANSWGAEVLTLLRVLLVCWTTLGFCTVGQAEILSAGFDLNQVSNDEVLNGVLKLTSKDGETSPELKLAIEHFRAGKIDAAFAAFGQARSSLPHLPPPEVMISRLLIASQKFEPVNGLLERAILDTPQSPVVALAFGEFALATGRNADAQLHFERVLDLYEIEESSDLSANNKAPAKILAAVYSGLAVIAERRLRWDQAQALLQKSQELAPKDTRLVLRKAHALFQQEQYQQATEELQRAVEIDANLPPAELTVGTWYVAAKKFDSATESFETALQQSPEDFRVISTATTYFLERGAFTRAEEVLNSSPSEEHSTRRFQMLRGNVARGAGDLNTAESCFENLLAEAPADIEAANQLAAVLAEQDEQSKRQRALQLAEVNFRQLPRSAELRATLGWALFQLERLDLAEQVFQPLNSGSTISPDAAYYYGRFLEARQQTEQAGRLYATAMQAQGVFIHRADCEQRVKSLLGERNASSKE
ncbi:tetratricopeptide repeat protein [Thalassoglobus sp.]|uniref:tetratricopeptide repeat protein n=1 Tax=Thalassoglobus sp. TaxID=2795869 RepID=UPI003AA90B05